MKSLSNKMLSLIERLAEMFPKQQYQSRLEQYINSKRPTNAADVDYWQRQYETEAKYWGRGL
jgi:conjugal transfer/entry exclusion protein